MTAIRSEGPVATDRTFEPEAGASGLAEDRFGGDPAGFAQHSLRSMRGWRGPKLAHEDDWDPADLDHLRGGRADNQSPDPRMPVGAHHQKVDSAFLDMFSKRLAGLALEDSRLDGVTAGMQRRPGLFE